VRGSLEGRGVTPDIVVPFDLRYAAGRDPQLDAALAFLQSTKTPWEITLESPVAQQAR
jgi:C-terminal processing protease CtpA/Prc